MITIHCIRAVALLSTCAALTARAEPPDPPGVTLGPDTPLTIVPIPLGGPPARDVADALGMLLEQAGMPHVQTTDTVFTPPNGDAATRAAAFGTWVAGQKFGTEVVVLAEIDGSPRQGAEEIRITLVDRAGRVRWTDRQTSGDRALRDAKATNPMACCMFLAERLKTPFRLTSAHRGRVQDGPMARRWAEKSGTPTAVERAAMQDRLATLKETLADTSVVVYPVQTNLDPPAGATADLAARIAAALPLKSAAVDAPLDLEVAPSRNQQRRLWDLARAFRAHLRANPVDAPYALVAEYTFVPTDKRVWTVHVVICDRSGAWVLVDFQNNHHADFNAVQPKTAGDCAELVVRRLRGHLR